MKDKYSHITKLCKKEFEKFLKKHAFSLVEEENMPYGFSLYFQNDSTEVEVSYVPQDGGVYLVLSCLSEPVKEDGTMIVNGQKVYHSYYFNDLIRLREKDAEEKLEKIRKVPGEEGTKIQIQFYKDALKKHAEEVLEGNFSVFTKLDTVIKKREKEAEKKDKELWGKYNPS
jgi:hypothetical protein